MTRKRFERLIIHAGMPKAGSSAIQKSLAKSRLQKAALMDLGGLHHNLACRLLFGALPETRQMFTNRGANPQQMEDHREIAEERMRIQLEGASERDLVISSEWLFRAPPDTLWTMLERLGPYFRTIEAYAYVRRPTEYIPSHLQQYMKGSGQGFVLQWPEYRRRLGNLDEVFGRESVKLKLFDKSRLLEQDACLDFASWARLPGLRALPSTVNKSLSAAGLALLACFRRHRPVSAVPIGDPLIKSLIVHLQTIASPKFFIAPERMETLLKANEDDLAWLADRLGHTMEHRVTRPPEDAVVFGSEDDLKRAAARFSPLLTGNAPIDPPADPDEADALAWARIKTFMAGLHRSR